MSFLSVFGNEYAGPDGGDGGNGGHVIIQGRSNNHWFNVTMGLLLNRKEE